jgi:nitroreductase
MENEAKIFENICLQRRSVRAFKKDVASPKILEALMQPAMAAPSNCNTQPWVVHVVSGEKLEGLREAMPSDFAAGKMSIDFPYDGSYDGVYQERQYGSAQALYDSVGVTRADKVERQEIFMRNFAFFGAPHVAFFFLPEPFGLREAADVGMFAQTFMLSLTAHGMGSCPQTSLSFQADLVRERLDIPSNQKLLFGISFGYPERDAPINACATDRAALGDLVTFHN